MSRFLIVAFPWYPHLYFRFKLSSDVWRVQFLGMWSPFKLRLHPPPHIDWLCWGLTTRQPLWVILCRLPEKGRKEIEEIVEEMKETIREEIGTGMKVKKQKK